MRRLLSTTLASGELEGYYASPRSPAIATEDADLCRQGRCGHCGRQDLDYRSFSKTGSYCTFGVCPTCRDSQEF